MLSAGLASSAAQPVAEPVAAVPHVVAPHPELQDALFCYAAGDDGAAAVLIRGWSALVAQVESEVARGDTPWADLLAETDEWSTDGEGVPYHYSASLEDGYIAIYRISEPAAQPSAEPLGPPAEGLANFHYRLDAASGYEQTGVYHDITAETFGKVIGALEGKLTVVDAAQPAPAEQPYADSTPNLHVGDSAFESWFATYSPAHKGDKQRARDAYAAGMGDPLVQPAGGAVPADIATRICRALAELPDRNSPEDWPEAMLVTADELRSIVLQALAAEGV